MHFVVDTNVFNRIADDRWSRAELPIGAILVATHIQEDEINRTSDLGRRAALHAAFSRHNDLIVPAESLIWGVSRWGQAKWGTAGHAPTIRERLDARNGQRQSNAADALIAEVAIVNGWGLVTADRDLAAVASEIMNSQHVVLID